MNHLAAAALASGRAYDVTAVSELQTAGRQSII
jgi:hypothetical protein